MIALRRSIGHSLCLLCKDFAIILLIPLPLQGFRELHALTEKHPSFDLHAFVASNTLPHYQNWVKRGLKAVEYEQQCRHRTRVSVTDPDSPLTSNVGHYVYTPNVWVCLCV